MLHGEHKTGKTTLASTFPRPLIVDIEGGSDDLDVARTERIKSYEEFENTISWLITNENDYSTIVIDSVDWLEALVWQFIAGTYGETSIEGTTTGSQLGFGKGYKYSAGKFEHIITGFRRLNEAGKAVLLICHSKNVKHSPPDGASYDRIEPDLHDRVQSILCEFVDEIFYIATKTFTRTEDLGFKKERALAVASNERIIVTGGNPAVVAGNRLSMPTEIPATFAEYAKYIGARPASTTGNIDGVVTDGSSKPKNEGN